MSVIYYGIFFFIFVIVKATTDSCEEYNDFECGRRSVLGKEVIANGTDADARNWPWLALVLKRDKDKDNNMNILPIECEGHIISRTAILTSAYCVYKNGKRIDTQNLLVQAGTSKYENLGTLNEIGRQILPVERVLVHPGYKRCCIPADKTPMLTCDLAILLVNKLVFTEYIQPICVWGPLYDKTKLFGQQAVIASFKLNYKSMFSIQVSNDLVRSDDTCLAYVPSFKNYLNEFTFCHGDISGTNPRLGAGGSGVALAETHDDNSVTWYLHGISNICITTPDGKCDPKIILLYIYVAPYYAWIHHHAFNN